MTHAPAMQSSTSTSSAMRPSASPPVHCTHASFLAIQHHPTCSHCPRCVRHDHPRRAVAKQVPHSVETHTLAQKVAPSSPWRCTPFPNVVEVSAVTLCSSFVALEMTKRSLVTLEMHNLSLLCSGVRRRSTARSSPWRCQTRPNIVVVSAVTPCTCFRRPGDAKPGQTSP